MITPCKCGDLTISQGFFNDKEEEYMFTPEIGKINSQQKKRVMPIPETRLMASFVG